MTPATGLAIGPVLDAVSAALEQSWELTTHAHDLLLFAHPC
jgi:hypothetical protein